MTKRKRFIRILSEKTLNAITFETYCDYFQKLLQLNLIATNENKKIS